MRDWTDVYRAVVAWHCKGNSDIREGGSGKRIEGGVEEGMEGGARTMNFLCINVGGDVVEVSGVSV